MEWEFIFLVTATDTKAILFMELRMVKGLTGTEMEIIILDNGRMILYGDKAHSPLKMETSIMEP